MGVLSSLRVSGPSARRASVPRRTLTTKKGKKREGGRAENLSFMSANRVETGTIPPEQPPPLQREVSERHGHLQPGSSPCGRVFGSGLENRSRPWHGGRFRWSCLAAQKARKGAGSRVPRPAARRSRVGAGLRHAWSPPRGPACRGGPRIRSPEEHGSKTLH